MTTQRRAEETRQRILDAAVALFDEKGYGNTTLQELMAKAELTKGAFYYHFSTKEAVAVALITEASARILDVYVTATTATTAPAMENLISSPFEVTAILRRDNRVRVGRSLRQATQQISSLAPETYLPVEAAFATAVARAIADGDIVDDIDPEELGHTLWAAVLGNRLLAEATGTDDVCARFVQMWRIALRAIVPAHKLPYFQQFVTRMERLHVNG